MRRSASQFAFVFVLIDLMLVIVCTSRDVKFHSNGDYHQKNRQKMYFAVAMTASDQSYTRAFNKTLANITQMYLENGPERFDVSVGTLIIELPKNGSFSASLLQTLCHEFEGKHVLAVFIVGDSPAAFTVSLAASHVGIPVLWARGSGGFLPGFRGMVSLDVIRALYV